MREPTENQVDALEEAAADQRRAQLSDHQGRYRVGVLLLNLVVVGTVSMSATAYPCPVVASHRLSVARWASNTDLGFPDLC
jgi:hypothetical protein